MNLRILDIFKAREAEKSGEVETDSPRVFYNPYTDTFRINHKDPGWQAAHLALVQRLIKFEKKDE